MLQPNDEHHSVKCHNREHHIFNASITCIWTIDASLSNWSITCRGLKKQRHSKKGEPKNKDTRKKEKQIIFCRQTESGSLTIFYHCDNFANILSFAHCIS